MNKKFLFFTSAVIMCMACPAIAETFPQDGNMVENETYANAAVYDNTGVYEGTATANAYYTTNNYNVSAGSYFTGLNNDNTATTATCTSGNYCPGVASTTYDDVNSAFVDDGLQSCPSGYASSDLGASADTQCYRTCDIANMGANGTIASIAHAASLSGNDYYGNGTDTCEPATCVAGWHVKEGVPDLASIVGTREGMQYSLMHFDGRTRKTSASLESVTEPGVFELYFVNGGKIKGNAICIDDYTPGTTTRGTYANNPSGEEGPDCYCRITGYAKDNGSFQELVTPYAFVAHDEDKYVSFEGMVSGTVFCQTNCTQTCASFSATLDAAVSAVTPTPAMCEANTINITWNDASAEDIAATGAATTVYEGDIKTPLKAVTKPGKTFVGWKFVKPTTPVQQ